MAHAVFISYATANSEVAQTICRSLEEAGIVCWIAPRDIVGGASWSDAIMEALSACRAVVLLLSAASNVSVQVHNEINEATNLKKAILPIRIENVPLSRHMAYYLGRLHWLSVLNGSLEDHLPTLQHAVQSALTAGEGNLSAPPSVVGTPQNNLPRQVSSFIGREKERREVQALLAATPLVTLLGTGGVGKTRLALQVAEDVSERYLNGVFLVELAALRDPALVPQTVADALGLREEPGQPLLQTLIDYLKTRHLLLVLDNCEHLITACAYLTGTLLKACPHLTLLATSREALNVTGEHSYRVPSLSLPDLTLLNPDQLSQSEAARLFVERARLAQPDFAVTDQNASALAALCHRLDGIPLALELAAARVRSLSLEEIVHRLEHSFRLLTGGSRTALPRQQTLRALIDWSYNLLNDQEKTLLCRLSVFSGGWTLEAAEQICGEGRKEKSEERSKAASFTLHSSNFTLPGIEEWEVLDLLTALTDKSLVVYEERDGVGRYRMLETVRQYADEKRQEAGEDAALRNQHVRYFLTFAEQAEPELLRADQSRWIARVEQEHDNLRTALDWCRQEESEAEYGLSLASILWRFWFLRCYLNEGRERLTEALRQKEGSPPSTAWAKALVGLGVLAYFQDDIATAQAACQQSLDLSSQVRDDWSLGIALLIVGVLQNFQGDFPAARQCFERCCALAKQDNDPWLMALALSDLGFMAFHQGDFAQAGALCMESLALSRQVGEKWCMFNSLYSLGLVLVVGGDFAQSRELFKEAMSISQELGHVLSIALCMEGLAGAWGAQGDAERAALLFGAAAARREKLGAAVPSAFRFGYDRTLDAVRSALGDAGFAAKWSEGQAMPFEQAITFALSDPS